MFKKVKKRAITLVEMMIVMFLIAMITGVIAYNYSGSLEEGKAFKTKAAIEKIETVVALYASQHPGETFEWKEAVKNSPFVKNADALMKDGWGEEFHTNNDDGKFSIWSKRYLQYEANKGNKR